MDLTNIDLPTLQLWVDQAQKSWQAWQVGGRIQNASYSQGNGSKSVAYAIANADQLRAWIASLQAEIARRTGAMLRPTRRAIGVRFGGYSGPVPWR